MTIHFFQTPSNSVIATEADHQLTQEEVQKLCWLYGEAELLDAETLSGYYVGPRREMVTPWSTNAVEITQNMAMQGISRIEEYFPVDSEDADHDQKFDQGEIALLHVGMSPLLRSTPIFFRRPS